MRISKYLRCAALIVALPPLLAVAQTGQDPEERQTPHLGALVESWHEQHGSEWRHVTDWKTGRLEMLYGGSAEAAFRPHTDADWILLAESFAAQTEDMHGLPLSVLIHERSVFLPLGAIGSSDKMTVRFHQVVDGVPVLGGALNVLMDAHTGALLSVQSSGIPEMAGVSITPTISGSFATTAAERYFGDLIGVPATSISAPELVFVQVEGADLRRAVLSWQFDVRWDGADAVPDAWTYWIDARTGALAKSENQIHHVDVGGTVRSFATTTTKPDTAGNPDVQVPMPYLQVTSSAGTVFTDANGNFNYPGVNGPLSCTFTYEGPYAEATNNAGTDYTLTVSLTGTGNSVLMNPASTATITSQANAFYEIAALRDWIRSVIPGDGTADFQARANCNLNSTCNAYFDGGSVNFYAAGGGCVNTAYSTVVAHEMGHWLNVLYGTGNGSDGMGEGNADIFAMYLYDTPIVGEDFFGNGNHIRTGNNTRQFCGDCCAGCHGGVHASGEVWMGAAWKIRRNLNNVHGNSTGDAIADLLFMGWMNSYNQTQIRSIIEAQWLTLDDNDGNIGNGTPNYSSIDSAFREQGFPGFDLDDIFIADVTILPDTQNETGPYNVQATITANVSPPLQTATLHYRVNDGAFAGVTMSPLGGEVYVASIPGQISPAVVDYYLSARDNAGVIETYPAGGAAEPLRFRVGILSVFLFNDFEGATNEGWTVGSPADDATTGTWVRAIPDATAAQPGEDTTPPPGVKCWLTGLTGNGGLGGNDIDNGQTTLTSPIFDASNLNDPEISYMRWFSNDEGASPSTDVFVVDISNNGGSTWVNVETVGPTGPQASGDWWKYSFKIADVITPTANMRLRFIASDEGPGSIVEAALDDIEGVDLGPVGITDCNGNGIPDSEDISNGTSQDCNANGIPDECDISSGTSSDCNLNGIPDDCETDCNDNGVPDDCDIAGGTSSDVNGNGIPDECECMGDVYCIGMPNSVGFGSLISFSGSLSVGQNDTALTAQHVPASQLGIFYYGTGQAQVPFGNGLRCVSGSTFRLPVTSTGTGTIHWALDLTAPPQPGGQITAGSTWNFQFWYRDPAGGGQGFNLSDAAELTFCD